MKLKHLQEAKYHKIDELLKQIDNAVVNNKSFEVDLRDTDFNDVVKLLSSVYGEPEYLRDPDDKDVMFRADNPPTIYVHKFPRRLVWIEVERDFSEDEDDEVFRP